MCACLFAPKVIRQRPSKAQVDHDGDDFEKLTLYKSTCDKKLRQKNKIIDKLHVRIINFHPPVPARALESENTLLQEEKGIIMRENTSNRATLEAKIQRYII